MYTISEIVDTFGRFERRHVIDSSGGKVAILTYPVAPDPDGISGNAAHITAYKCFQNPDWHALIDRLGIKSARGEYQLEYRGDLDNMLAAITGGK